MTEQTGGAGDGLPGPSFIILGAGFSGLGMAIRLRQEGFGNVAIYEKADEVGGTWRENVYPGVACDVPSHLYSFSFEPNPDWSRRFSPGAEIQAYLERCAREYDLYPSIRFGKKALRAAHDGRRWRVDFEDGETAEADYLISGLGGLHEPNIPEFKDMDAFHGPVFHTARWREDVDLAGRRVAVIGSAASAVQVIPEIVGKVAHLDIYQRTPNWVMPRESYAYPDWLKRIFARAPWLMRLYRGLYFSFMEWRFGSFRNEDNAAKRVVRRTFDRHMTAQIRDEALRAKLTPDYPVGCKRILISDDYLPAVQRENVDLVTEPIEAFTAEGVATADGKTRPADVIILATGFKPFDILTAFEVTGPSGLSLREAWKDGIAAHRTVAAPGFPNFFLLLGPNSGLGHNSVVLMIEAQANYILKLIRAADAAPGALIEPTPDAARAYDADIQARLGKRVWATGCGAWYVDENGRNYTLYPDNVRAFLKEMKTPDLGEYVITMQGAVGESVLSSSALWSSRGEGGGAP